MALDITEGEYVPTVYGTQHLGSIESYIAAFNFRIFGFDVVAFRAAGLALMALFFLAHTWTTTLLPDGNYHLEVEASDLRGNKGGLALPFTLANNV